MKLTTFILMITLMQVSAASFGQRVTLTQSNITVEKIFREIRKQTGYDVLIVNTKFDISKRLNADFKEASLETVMNKIVLGTDLSYTIEDKSVVIKEKAVSLIEAVKEKVSGFFQQDTVQFRFKVVDEKGLPLPGASVKLKGNSRTYMSSQDGLFNFRTHRKDAIIVSYVGYMTQEMSLAGKNPNDQIVVKMVPGQEQLGEVGIVSTGYQDIPKERATGSFEIITKEQLQHSSDPNLIKRLEGITTSMNFNNQLRPINSASPIKRAPLEGLTIRGKNTLNATATFGSSSGYPLIVIDGIANAYSIDDINPNNIENITILKDAAAASIWGSRAANGVIVIKTKRSGFESPTSVSFNSNISISQKFDLYYRKLMSVSDFVDAQILAFEQSPTDLMIPNLDYGAYGQEKVSPVTEIMDAWKTKHTLTDAEANAQLNALRKNDVRNDYNKYILRNGISQNYSLGISGGTKKVAWSLFGGYDKNRRNTVHSDDDRINLQYNASFRPLKNLELQANIVYTRSTSYSPASENIISADINPVFYPYSRLADEQGNFLPIPKMYRPAFVNFISSTYGNRVLDMTYTPLQDINEGYNKTNSQGLNFNLNGIYKISSALSANVTYSFNPSLNQGTTVLGQNSFYMRELINRFTTPPTYLDIYTYQTVNSRNPFERQIPLGGLYSPSFIKGKRQTLRGQLNLDRSWNEKHQLSAIAGIDVAQNYYQSRTDQYFGYNEKTLRSNTALDYADLRPMLWLNSQGQGMSRIPYSPSNIIDEKVRTLGIFFNSAYTYLERYTISASLRRDGSSEFGMGTNKKGTPFYSFGGKWNVANEPFYKLSWLPILALRATFGYNGNVNPLTIGRPLITYQDGTDVNELPSASTTSYVSNRDLRPERTGQLNLGVDFGLANGINGSFEFYDKRTTDLIAGAPVALGTGFSNLTYNVGNLHGWGYDFTLNTKNIQQGLFSWSSTFLFSFNKVKVTKLYAKNASTAGQFTYGVPTYNEGAELSRLYAYRWGGLDPNTGDPRGYDANGNLLTISSTSEGAANFATINTLPGSTAVYFGSSVPVYYGAFRNTFNYGRFSASANILYKLGYYFRRPAAEIAQYNSLFSYNVMLGEEYSRRWKNPGDEIHTNVPSLTFPVNSDRDLFYQYSEVNVLRADHVRLQEINLSYVVKSKPSWFIKNPRIYANLPLNIMIWKANKAGLDPDVFDYPMPKTYSFGISASF